MARHESGFRATAGEMLSLDELLTLLGNATEIEGRSREDAIACYLSGDDGWREALKLLGGTFAQESERLKDRKTD